MSSIRSIFVSGLLILNGCGAGSLVTTAEEHFAGSGSCDDFSQLSIGVVTATLNGSSVSIDWENDLSESATGLSVGLSGGSPEPQALQTKPAAFSDLVDADWTATITYSKTGCDSLVTTETFTSLAGADCTDWNNLSVGTVAATVSDFNDVSINWSGGTVTGQDSFTVSVTGGPSSPAALTNTQPAAFADLSAGTYSAVVKYKKAGCTDRMATASFTASAWPAPTVTSVSPTTGTMNGGTSLTINGTNFRTGATVAVGGKSCASVSFVSDTQLTCTTIARLPATVAVVVTNTDAQSGTKASAYQYTGTPTFTLLQSQVFTSCTACHSGGSPQNGLDITDYSSVTASAVRINTGSATATDSGLYNRINSGDMPRSGGPLSAEQIQAVADWIASGSANN